MKIATALLIGAFTIAPAASWADHPHHDRHCDDKHYKHHKHHGHDHWRDRGRRYEHQVDYRDDDRNDYGRVIDVQPVYRYYKEPVNARSCLRVDDSRPQYRSYTATVLGAVVGGAIGHRIGDAHGDPKAAAVAGGLLGASLGRDIDRQARDRRRLVVEGPCRVSYREETRRELVEYKVTYRYNGEIHRARMDYDPGDWVKLDVNVAPS